MGTLSGKRIMVVGASTGVGRASAQAFVKHGANVVFAARRAEHLNGAVTEAGGGHAVVLDVQDEESIGRGVSRAVEILGGLDSLIYTAGMSPIKRLSEADAALWNRIFAVNTFGPSLVFKAALPHLASDAVVAAMSSDSAAQPRHSLVPYAASKAALEAAMEGWRTEELGGRRFMTICIGPTQPTDFAVNFTPEEMGALIPHWARQGFRTGMQNSFDVGEMLAQVLGALFAAPTLGMEHVLLRAPEPEAAVSDFGHSTL